MYQITFKDSANKELQKIDKLTIAKIVIPINALSKSPRPIGVKKLKGLSEDLFRIRVGNYRIVYSINDIIKIVNIRRIGHREDIYR